jgi:4-hydroxy-tetrahydrodipicolinate reductase
MAASASAASAANAPLRVVLIGASGRMGRQIVRLLPAYPGLRLSGAVVSSGSALIGRDAGALAGVGELGVALTGELRALLAGADVVLDFSQASAAASTLSACVDAGVPLLIGTTGVGSELESALAAAARAIALLVAPNVSLGVALLLELVRRAAQTLPASYDIEIIEAHHRGKRDAPSGTALALAEAAAQSRGDTLAQRACFARPRSGPAREARQIGFAVVRGGDVVGEHQVLFLGEGERLTLAHSASDRAVFARGALSAAQWLARQAPGRYAMADYLLHNSDL